MRKIKEILRLKFELGLGNRQIARSCSINHSTVADYLRRAVAANLNLRMDGWSAPLQIITLCRTRKREGRMAVFSLWWRRWSRLLRRESRKWKPSLNGVVD
jgi:hypothetical protein